jgi:hypothetical protein
MKVRINFNGTFYKYFFNNLGFFYDPVYRTIFGKKPVIPNVIKTPSISFYCYNNGNFRRACNDFNLWLFSAL